MSLSRHPKAELKLGFLVPFQYGVPRKIQLPQIPLHWSSAQHSRFSAVRVNYICVYLFLSLQNKQYISWKSYCLGQLVILVISSSCCGISSIGDEHDVLMISFELHAVAYQISVIWSTFLCCYLWMLCYSSAAEYFARNDRIVICRIN